MKLIAFSVFIIPGYNSYTICVSSFFQNWLANSWLTVTLYELVDCNIFNTEMFTLAQDQTGPLKVRGQRSGLRCDDAIKTQLTAPRALFLPFTESYDIRPPIIAWYNRSFLCMEVTRM